MFKAFLQHNCVAPLLAPSSDGRESTTVDIDSLYPLLCPPQPHTALATTRLRRIQCFSPVQTVPGVSVWGPEIWQIVTLRNRDVTIINAAGVGLVPQQNCLGYCNQNFLWLDRVFVGSGAYWKISHTWQHSCENPPFLSQQCSYVTTVSSNTSEFHLNSIMFFRRCGTMVVPWCPGQHHAVVLHA